VRKGQDVADTVEGRGVGPVVSSRRAKRWRRAKRRQAMASESDGGRGGGVYSQCEVVGSTVRGAEEEGRGGGGRSARCR